MVPPPPWCGKRGGRNPGQRFKFGMEIIQVHPGDIKQKRKLFGNEGQIELWGESNLKTKNETFQKCGADWRPI